LKITDQQSQPNTSMKSKYGTSILALLAVMAGALHLHAQGTAFTYQGRLLDNGQPATGLYNLSFRLYDDAVSGAPQGDKFSSTTAVSNGLFTVALDFGDQFSGRDRWLEISVRTNGSGAFTTLTSRQQITATPYAVTAGAVTGPVAVGQVTGSLPVSQVSGTLPLAQLPPAVVTNGASGVNLTGTFTGNGGDLTNVAAGNLVGTIADARLSVNVPRLNVPNTTATATGVPIVNSGFITSANVTSGGSGYLTPPLVKVNAVIGGGGGAILTADVAGGSVTRFTVANPGSGYSGSVTLTVAPPPSNAFQTFITPNFFSGVNTMTNANNTFAGSFSGNGAALTNIPTSAVAAAPPGMVPIAAGDFTIGDTLAGLGDAHPTNVTVSAFYMDVNLVSWSQWQSVYYWATNRGYAFTHAGAGKAANHPVHTVDWYDCVKWCNARSQQAGKPPVYYTDAGWTAVYTNGEPTTLYANWSNSGYRLPTEAEWEKAARGGVSGQRFPWGNVINQNLANYQGVTAFYTYDLGPNGFNPAITNGGQPYTSPVGSFAANGYGLNDMAGNVHEWCWDWYGTYAGGIDPRGPAGPLSYRVLRGGAWDDNAVSSQCAFRGRLVPDFTYNHIGFRCVSGF
jgi:formylglycine-generating enzyme required for sulfatase activity